MLHVNNLNFHQKAKKMHANVDWYTIKCMGEKNSPTWNLIKICKMKWATWPQILQTQILYAFQHNKFTPYSFMYCKKKTWKKVPHHVIWKGGNT